MASSYPISYRYTEEHEWAALQGKQVKVGITDYAQSELGDVVFVDLPEVGKTVQAKDTLLSVESVKAVSDVYAPISGAVVEVNDALREHPELVNSDPHNGGWMVILEVSDFAESDALMSQDAYVAHIAGIQKGH